MPSLLEQLQREALDSSTSVASLLRKLKVAAVMLEKEDAVTWVDHELSGYPEDAELPAYRVIRGRPQFLNPMVGWCPLMVNDSHGRELMSRHRARQRISELEELARQSASEGGLVVPYPSALIQDIERSVGFEIGGAGVAVERSTVVGILDAVRTRALDWALALWRAGVRGEESGSFSRGDREAASTVMYNVVVGGPFTGNVGSVSGGATVHATHVGPATVETLTQLASQIEQHAGEMSLSEPERGRLERDVAELRQEIRRPAPDVSVLGRVLSSIRAIAENAAGGLIASGILHVMARPEIAALIQRVGQ
ncbi:AbiTii domain-containing protein [Anaeromyxobacter soli]|uniref:AbiTii domain-containing protein n=1 Tax=Anaeromyxobacter soli TaxID=2922725 RepID=UPI001FAF34F5|nr:hypothetical protein [Anaeromyxobacter sp. SG29]